jgi:predicted nucleotidyltransferase
LGRPRRSALLPPWSDAQAKILAAVLLADEGLHIRRIADLAGVSYSVAQREVDRLEKSGLLSSTRFQTSRVVRPNDRSSYLPELRGLLLKAYGPRTELAAFVERVDGVEEAFVFGSWAARYEGEWGDEPGDVDVLFIGEPDPRAVEEFEAIAEDRLGRPVQVTVVSRDTWEHPPTSFVRTLKNRPLVPIEVTTVS